MRITITTCYQKLINNFGIDMNQIGSYDRLCSTMSNYIAYSWLEYDFTPYDCIYMDVADNVVIPDLSQFGEVQPYGNSMG